MIDSLVKGRLSPVNFPVLDGGAMPDRPQEIIVFFVGGSTYEEAHYVEKYNELVPGVSIVLAGTTVHNGALFMDELIEAMHRL